jgi:hypothetical protein
MDGDDSHFRGIAVESLPSLCDKTAPLGGTRE